MTIALKDIDTDERRIYRDALYAALDQLHLAQQEIERQRRQIAETREERTRYARGVFGEE